MSISKKIIITVTAGAVLGISSCRKFLNVNTNPNGAQYATVQTLLPAAQLYSASALGCELEITGSIWGEYWTQSPNSSQYRSLEQYAPGQDYFATPWQNLYSANENFFQVAKLADSLKKKQYKAIALLMEAYNFGVIADGWGDAPFSQALKGQPADGGILNPKYDSVKTIYRGMIKYIDSALALVDNTDASKPGTDDLIYGGNMTQWAKFGNTLKLRTYLRMSSVDVATASAGVAALYASGAQFLGAGDDAKIGFGYTTTNKNPLYAEMSSTTLAKTQNLVGSKTCIDSLNNNDDYRAYVFYEALSNGSVSGIAQGNYDVVAPGGSFSIPNVYVGGDANNTLSSNAPVNFMTGYESLFLQAEAAARTWGTGNDSVLYYQAIAANFNYYSSALMDQVGLDGPSSYSIYVNGDVANAIPPGYWAVYPTTGTVADRLRFIITQKWFSMCGNQGFEAWTEYRRTGYPDFLVHSPNSLIGASFPKRFLYPTSESTRNSAFPGLQPVTSKVWWDLF